jgi:hypothetical protein
VRLDRRRHGDDPPVDQLVAGVGAVVPFEELGQAHALFGGLDHATKDRRSERRSQLLRTAALRRRDGGYRGFIPWRDRS